MQLNIIGCGHVGRVFGALLQQHAQVHIQDILNRSAASSDEAVAWLGSGQACTSFTQLRPAQLWLIGVGDDQIASTADSLAAQHCVQAGDIVFHCSGALPSSVLAVLRAQGASVASVHPVRSFADSSAVLAQFSNTFCCVEGDAPALAALLPLLQMIGAQTLTITAENKSLYHAASVMACNYLTSLLDVALRTWQQAGIAPAQARQLAEPLARQTLDNIFRLGPAQALTGPIARGDMQTVARQQQALQEWDGAAADLYRAFTATTLELAQRQRDGRE